MITKRHLLCRLGFHSLDPTPTTVIAVHRIYSAPGVQVPDRTELEGTYRCRRCGWEGRRW